MFPDSPSTCVPSPIPTAGMGESCTLDLGTGIDDCGPQLLCWNTLSNGAGTCIPLCDASGSGICQDPSTACGLPWANADAGVCAPGCDPLIQDCDSGEGCYEPSDQVFVCLPAPASPGPYGTPCGFSADCDPGLSCSDPAGVPGCMSQDGCCTPWCDLSDPNSGMSCPGMGQGCVPIFAMGQAPPGYENVGICRLP